MILRLGPGGHLDMIPRGAHSSPRGNVLRPKINGSIPPGWTTIVLVVQPQKLRGDQLGGDECESSSAGCLTVGAKVDYPTFQVTERARSWEEEPRDMTRPPVPITHF